MTRTGSQANRRRRPEPLYDRAPETPEGVAAMLFHILRAAPRQERAQCLDLFHECLMAARGERVGYGNRH